MPSLVLVKTQKHSRFLVVHGVGVVVVGGVRSVQTLQTLLLLLHEVGVGAGAGGGRPRQPAVGPRMIPGRDGRRRRGRSRAGGRGRGWDLGRDRDGGRVWRGQRRHGGGAAVVGMVVVEGDGGGRLRLSLAVVVVVVVVLGWRRGRGRRRDGRLGRRSRRRRRSQVFVLLAEAVQLDLQLLDSPPLGFQKLLLALDDVVQLQQVLHGPVGAFRAALTRTLVAIHLLGLTESPQLQSR